MTVHLIHGQSGSGKSTIGRALEQNGYLVIDGDSIASWVSNNQSHTISKPEYPISAEWLKQHSWNWNQEEISTIVRKSSGQTVFICGGASNESVFYRVFGLRFFLWTDGLTVKQRLQAREPHRWTDQSPELVRRLEINHKRKIMAIRSGSIILDTRATPIELVEEIFAHVQRFEESRQYLQSFAKTTLSYSLKEHVFQITNK